MAASLHSVSFTDLPAANNAGLKAFLSASNSIPMNSAESAKKFKLYHLWALALSLGATGFFSCLLYFLLSLYI